jgi:hypothetical protein
VEGSHVSPSCISVQRASRKVFSAGRFEALNFGVNLVNASDGGTSSFGLISDLTIRTRLTQHVTFTYFSSFEHRLLKRFHDISERNITP